MRAADAPAVPRKLVASCSILADMVRQVPPQTAGINARAAAYLGAVDTLDKAAKARFAAVPAQQRRVITTP